MPEWENTPKTASGAGTKVPERGTKVSVIIPVYNVAPYVREALDSVVNQTYEELEIIVVDDGSTDGSSQICDEYKSDSRVTVIHQKNGGLSNARNTGLDHATGQYIAFLDPDDAYHPSFIEKLLSAITDADIAVCRFTVQKTDGRLITKKRVPYPSAKAGTYGREDSLRMLVNGIINWSVWNKLYRAELWKSKRFPNGHNFEDINTTYRVIDLSASVTVIDQVLYFYRCRPGSITQTVSWKNIDDRKKALSHLEEFVRIHTPEIFSEKHVFRIQSSFLSDMLMRYIKISSGDEFGEVQKENLRKEIIATGQEIGMDNFSIRLRAAFFMLKHCPCLLKIAYSVYMPLRLLVRKVIGR